MEISAIHPRKTKLTPNRDYLARHKQKSIFKMIRKTQESKRDKSTNRQYKTRERTPKNALNYSNIESLSRSAVRASANKSRAKSTNIREKKKGKRLKSKCIKWFCW